MVCDMAWLARCPYCREEIRSRVRVCPHCRTRFTGREQRGNDLRGAFWLTAGLGVFAAVFFFTPLGECATCGQVRGLWHEAPATSRPPSTPTPPTPNAAKAIIDGMVKSGLDAR